MPCSNTSAMQWYMSHHRKGDYLPTARGLCGLYFTCAHIYVFSLCCTCKDTCVTKTSALRLFHFIFSGPTSPYAPHKGVLTTLHTQSILHTGFHSPSETCWSERHMVENEQWMCRWTMYLKVLQLAVGNHFFPSWGNTFTASLFLSTYISPQLTLLS